ncbi:MAG: hypothetical protein HRT40_12285 [Campylobacteraceae bacterium]|nr:hypothetical protein [Campylobacteraceae bacterium]
MKNKILKVLTICFVMGFVTIQAHEDFKIKSAKVEYIKSLDLLVFSQEVKGKAGNTKPKINGKLHGASVFGYVFPTSLKSTDVGFNKTEGIVALALTSHPDFDDTPLWDENNDKNFKNDGIIWHSHWVILVKDKRVKGGLKVKEFKKDDNSVVIPPINPGMPMYMDSPGFSVLTKGNTIKVLIPANRVNNKINFNYDAVSVMMKVNTSGKMPLLGVYKIYSVLEDKLDLKNNIKKLK